MESSSRAIWSSFTGPEPSVNVYAASLPSLPGAKLEPLLDQPTPMSFPSGSATPAKPSTRPYTPATPSTAEIRSRTSSERAYSSLGLSESAYEVTATATSW